MHLAERRLYDSGLQPERIERRAELLKLVDRKLFDRLAADSRAEVGILHPPSGELREGGVKVLEEFIGKN